MSVGDFKITVLGMYAPFPYKGGNCPGYLLNVANRYYLLDCGNGCVSQLQKHINLEALSGVFLTHHHADHVADLTALRHAWEYLYNRGDVNHPLPVYTPSEPVDAVEALIRRESLAVYLWETMGDLVWEDVIVSALQTSHHLPCLAYRFEYRGKRFVYSGDTRYHPGKETLASFAQGADLFLLEGGHSESAKQDIDPNYLHMSAFEAAKLAKQAEVKELLITHCHPRSEKSVLTKEAKEMFLNSQLVVENRSYQIC